MKDNFEIKWDISLIIGMILLIFFLMFGTNACSESDWNNGICPSCEVRYELRGASQSLKYYSCPNCGREVKRY